MDLILVNGKVTTMDVCDPKAEAVAVKDGKFVKVGNNEEVLSLKTSNTTVLDLKGKMLLPGFNDSHMHLLNYGYSLQKASLIGSDSIETVIDRTQKFITKNNIGTGKWVLGRGWNQELFQVKRFPTKKDLDKISTEHPICLTRACEHVLVVNSKALEIAGINKDTPQVEGGHFDLDAAGNPLGIFREKALDLIYSKIDVPEVAEIKNMIVAAAKKAVAQGLTSIQTDDFEALPGRDFHKVLQAYKELEENNELPVRIYQQCLLPHIDKLKTFLGMGYNTGDGNSFFKIGPLKLLGDGSLGARTAYLSQPYADDSSTQGIPIFSQKELDELVMTAHLAGMQVAIHAIGDKMMYMAFDSIEKALKTQAREDHRHSIIHCQITDEALLNKYRDLNVIAHIQPIFIHSDHHIVEDRIGAERVKTTYNWKTMFDKGVHVACGSDCPVEPLDVLPGIYAAVTRQDLDGNPKGGWLPEENLTLDQALYGFTLGAAFASFEEAIKGSISVGKLADMVVLERNLYEIHPDDIKDVKIEMTFVNGKLVYQL